MDVSIFVESWREGIKHNMRRETFVKKAIVSIGGIITLICCSLVGAYYMAYWGNVLKYQKVPEVVAKYN